MSNKYLFNEEPKSFSPTIAKALGSISKAVIMQQVHFWLHVYTKKADQKHFFDGYYWVFNSYGEWHKDLDFIPFATMKRQILELERDNLLVSSEFNKNRGDRTKWYRINYEHLTVLTTGIELNRLVHFEPPSDHFEPPSDHFEPPSDHFEPPSDHFDPLYIQSDHQSDHQSDQQKTKRAKTFFSDSLNQNQAMQQEENSADSANKQDPTPLRPAPLSDAAIALKTKFEAKFDRKANKYEPHGLTSAGYGEWHLGEVKDGSKLDSYNNWKKSLIITAQNRKRLLHQPETVIAAAQYIRNTFERCKDKDYWADFESLIAEAIAYEQALASNPVLNQPQEAESPQTSTQAMPQVGEIDANGMVLMVDCRWSHFYPRSGRLAKKADGETQVFWDIESRHPPEPISDRLSKFFAEKLGNDLEKIKALLEAKHYAHESLKGYDYQVQMFVDQKSELVTAFNQEIEKLLHLQAA